MRAVVLKRVKAVAGLILFAALLLLACAITFSVAQLGVKTKSAIVDIKTEELPTVIIDAGHGGIDSGTVGRDGSLEKNINLDVAKRLEALFRLSGIKCVMTRTEDNMLVEPDIKSHRKMHDLKNRLAVAKGLEENGEKTLFVSIHMNNFSDPIYSGLQVWYSPSEAASREAASYVQDYAKKFLDSNNTREIKRASSSIYILDHITTPAILIECGFLSNPEECAKLGTESYQKELAVTIFSAICEYISTR